MAFSETSAAPAEPNVTPTTSNSLEDGNPSLADNRVVGLENGDVENIGSDIELSLTTSTYVEDITTVHWDGSDDRQNPMNWSPVTKWLTIALISLGCFNVSMVSAVFAPAVPEVEKEFHWDSSAISPFMVSVYVIRSAVGPLALTPITEVTGRLPITHISNVLFLIAAIVCSMSINMTVLIVARFFMGIASSVPVTVGGGFVADLMPMDMRGTAMTIWTVGPLMGFVAGPIMGGYIVENIGWRWTVWIEVFLGTFVVIASFIFLRETYAPKILERKAARLQKATKQPHKTRYLPDKSFMHLMWKSITRPIKFLIGSPVVLILSLYSAVTYSYLYILFITITELFEEVYNFSPGQAGLGYLGLGFGFVIGQATLGYFSDRHLKKQAKICGKMKPEDRLPPLVLGCCFVPIGLFWYGWAAEYRVHWFVMIAGTFFVGLGIYYIHLVAQLYLIDAYAIFSASAAAAELFMRTIFGATIPLAGPALYRSVGLGWGNTILGLIAVAFSPALFLLIKYSERLRTHPKFQPHLTWRYEG